MTRPRTSSVVDYAQGLGGRICDLPPNYLDAVADALVIAHPSSINRRSVIYLLTTDGWRRSRHPLLRGVTPSQVRALFYQPRGDYQRDYRERVRAARLAAGLTSKTHRVSQFTSLRAVARVIQSSPRLKT